MRTGSRTDLKPKDGDKTRRGPPAGHAGVSHGNKAERTATLHVRKCEACGRGHLSQLPPRIKMVYDFAVDGAMRIECVAYVIERAAFKRCGVISAANPPTIHGTSLGPRALGFVEEYYAKRSTDETVSHYFEALYGFGNLAERHMERAQGPKEAARACVQADPGPHRRGPVCAV